MINRTKCGAALTALASLWLGCGSDGDQTDKIGSQGSANPPSSAPSQQGAESDVVNTQALLRAAQASAGAAQSDAKSCFDKLRGCMGDGGAPSQACVDQLSGCLPQKPPAPMGCPKIPDLTPGDIGAIDDAVGKANGIVDDAINAAGGLIDTLLDGGVPVLPWPDGGFSLPTGAGGPHVGATGGAGFTGGGTTGGFGGAGGAPGAGRPDHNKDRDPVRPGALADGGVPAHPTGDAHVPMPPSIDADASIGGGELCGVPLPTIPIGALKACADKAAADLMSGQDPVTVASAAFSCIEQPFHDDLVKLCDEAKSECAKPGAPPNICADVAALCP